MATTQDISLDANGKVVVGKSKAMQGSTPSKDMQDAMKKSTSCDVGKAYPVPVRKVWVPLLIRKQYVSHIYA